MTHVPLKIHQSCSVLPFRMKVFLRDLNCSAGAFLVWTAALPVCNTRKYTGLPSLYSLLNTEVAEQTYVKLLESSKRVTLENHRVPSGSTVILEELMRRSAPLTSWGGKTHLYTLQYKHFSEPQLPCRE